jgi:hypothetical protein
MRSSPLPPARIAMLAPSIIDALPGMAALIASATRLALVASN